MDSDGSASGIDRRQFLRGATGVAALAALGGVGLMACDAAPEDAYGLSIVESERSDRLYYFRLHTDEIGWNPGVNVILPRHYGLGGENAPRFPVLFWLHGGAGDFRSLDTLMLELTEGLDLIVVMPDGGTAGWYCNPVKSNVGPRNWENFHIQQLVPWVDHNFRTRGTGSQRAVGGFSMGGFGALKYVARFPAMFASMSAHSGPPSLRRDGGIVVHWANTSSAAAELGGGSVYGMPLWNQAQVSADNPVEHPDAYRGKRVFLVCGLGDDVNETPVRNGQREFHGLLDGAGIAHEYHELEGTHFVRPEMIDADLRGIVDHFGTG